ncbi:MAG TPA: hypothetical protein VGK49_10495, partial [Ilumatobacteraceae bacterium]
LIEEGQAAGEFRDDIDPQMAMLAVLGMFNWIHRWYKPAGKRSLEQIGEEFADLAIASLRPVPAPVVASS